MDKRKAHWLMTHQAIDLDELADEIENAPPKTPEERKRISEEIRKAQAEYRKARAKEAGDEQLKSKETDTGDASK